MADFVLLPGQEGMKITIVFCEEDGELSSRDVVLDATATQTLEALVVEAFDRHQGRGGRRPTNAYLRIKELYDRLYRSTGSVDE